MPGEREAYEDAGVFRAKALAEIRQADALVPGAELVCTVGGPYAAVLVVKGAPSEDDRAAGQALAGSDGDAIRRALAALGIPGEPARAVSRPTAGVDPQQAAERVRRLAEAVEAGVVIALDPEAAADVGAAFGAARLEPGVPVRASGRVLLATDDFVAALEDERSKRVVWRQLKSLAAPAVPETRAGRLTTPCDHGKTAQR